MQRLTVVIALAFLAVACSSGGEAGAPSPSPSVSMRPSTTAKLSVVKPAQNSTVKGPDVQIELKLAGGRIVPLTTQNLKPDEGHIHVLLDGRLISQTEGLKQTLKGVAVGAHTLRVEFVASDHAPFDPRLFQIVTFNVS